MTIALRSLAVGLGLLGALATGACGDDESGGSSTPAAPPGLSIVAVQGVGGPRWEPGKGECVELGQDPDQTVVVTIAVSSFLLRPPGTCSSGSQCGTALLRIDPSGDSEALQVRAAQTALEAKLGTLGAGSHVFRVELRDDGDAPVIDKEAGGPLVSEVTLTVKAPGGCGGAVDAGGDADASASDAGDAGDAGDAMPEAEAGDDGSADAGDAASEAAPDAGDASSDASDAASE